MHAVDVSYVATRAMIILYVSNDTHEREAHSYFLCYVMQLRLMYTTLHEKFTHSTGSKMSIDSSLRRGFGHLP